MFCGRAWAVEGPTAAGPIGGTDIRSAVLPPPGVYWGAVGLMASTTRFVDGDGNTPTLLSDAKLSKGVAGTFLLYVPPCKIFGGSIGIGGVFPIATVEGHLFSG